MSFPAPNANPPAHDNLVTTTAAGFGEDHPVLRIGCVPEHYSVPLHMAAEASLFAKHGVQVEVVICPKGTGEMTALLRDGGLDGAIALTEGLVADIANRRESRDYRIVAQYTNNSLRWGVAVAPDGPVERLDDLSGGIWGISRYGSGSHVMAHVTASQRGWEMASDSDDTNSESSHDDEDAPVVADRRPTGMSFRPCGGMEALVDGVVSGATDAFIWETFMLQNEINHGRLRRVDVVEAPWPAFCLAVREDVIASRSDEVAAFLDATQEACAAFHTDEAAAIDRVAKAATLSDDDAKTWVRTMVDFSRDGAIEAGMIEATLDQLVSAGVVSAAVPVSDLVASL